MSWSGLTVTRERLPHSDGRPTRPSVAFTQEPLANASATVVDTAVVADGAVVAVGLAGAITTESLDGTVSTGGTDSALPCVNTVAAGRPDPEPPHAVAYTQSAAARARHRATAEHDMARHHTACLSTSDFGPQLPPKGYDSI